MNNYDDELITRYEIEGSALSLKTYRQTGHSHRNTVDAIDLIACGAGRLYLKKDLMNNPFYTKTVLITASTISKHKYASVKQKAFALSFIKKWHDRTVNEVELAIIKRIYKNLKKYKVS